MINHLILIALGGSIGAILRYLFTLAIPINNLPLATLSVNVIGSLLIGIAFYFLQKTADQDFLKYFIIIGVFGSFTTFSTFSLDIFRLIEQKQIILSLIYLISSVSLSILAVFAGYFLSKNVF